ncbi:Uncharacterized membrane protein [Humidesulfovibrio mexicanus]|jgi:uncharacterized membrane protein|uniref:Uncharacterized membrane protein n=1 Tax=Humidesulfovibrio mexicanus TaxID=147047 RepID=A0A239C9H1_9BACT|nr:zinc-ribbon domain-containing protein [Humidesulfovibrio mexicanus]SNS16867.1 Uncharacterized membrane protein [Humidesulfovibrio mexicanus]
MHSSNMQMHGAYDMRENGLRKTLQLCYALFGLGYVCGGIPAIVAVIIDYIKKDDAIGYPLLQEHFRWQINTFWVQLGIGIVGAMTLLFVIGFPILIIGFCWGLYRAIKGWIYLSDGRSLYGYSQPGAPTQTPYAQPQQTVQANAGKRFCTSCGGQLEPDAAFCSNCGAKLP